MTVFGHNTNLKIGNITFHVQTEDRGEAHALIDTTVYYFGRVLHRRTNNYFDLLPLDDERRQALKLRVDEQHRTVIGEVRSGALHLAIPEAVELPRPAEKIAPSQLEHLQPASEPPKLLLELANAGSWLSGKHAKLRVSVREPNGVPVFGAQVRIQMEGSENGTVHLAQTGSQGQAQIEFDMPRITSPEAALVIRAENQGVTGHLRFALRAKPRVA